MDPSKQFRARPAVLLRLLVCALAIALVVGGAFAQKRAKLPQTEQMNSGVVLERNRVTGELKYCRGAECVEKRREESPRAQVIRSQVDLVEVSCTVLRPDGTEVRGLTKENFQVYEDGTAQEIAHFDAASEAASVALVLDASPSVMRDLGEMKRAARTMAANLSPEDEVAVVAFAGDVILLLAFSRDRDLLEKSIERVEILRGAEKAQGSNIYGAVYLAAQQLFRGRNGRKAIVLLTDGQDSELGLSWSAPASSSAQAGSVNRLTFEDVARTLSASGVDLYAVSTQPRPKMMTEEWIEENLRKRLVSQESHDAGIPHYTAYLAELVRLAGGKLYFLRELETLSEVYRRIAKGLGVQYTLAFYAKRRDSNWHGLRVEVPGHGGLRVRHRVAYYAPVPG